MKSKGYTLWLMPTGEEYNRFANLIKKLAKEYGGPVFQPHVTLLGGIMLPDTEIVKRTKQLMLGQKSFIVNLMEIDYQDSYFRTLFVRAEKTNPLLSLHNRSKNTFEMWDVPSYMPHLSLLYGTFPIDTKKRIIKEIGKDQSAKFKISSVHLIRGGEVEGWHIVGEFPFFSPSR